jgi:hypothetical protein
MIDAASATENKKLKTSISNRHDIFGMIALL